MPHMTIFSYFVLEMYSKPNYSWLMPKLKKSSECQVQDDTTSNTNLKLQLAQQFLATGTTVLWPTLHQVLLQESCSSPGNRKYR